MKNKLTNLVVAFTAVLMLGIGLTLSPTAAAVDCSNQAGLSTQQAIQCGANGASGNTQDTATNSTQATNNLNTTISNLINTLSVVVGIVAVIMIIVGGFRYVTSGGKEESIKSAKNTIMYALIGLVIVALAQIIVQFVLNKATDTTSPSAASSSSSSSTPSGSGCGGGRATC